MGISKELSVYPIRKSEEVSHWTNPESYSGREPGLAAAPSHSVDEEISLVWGI